MPPPSPGDKATYEAQLKAGSPLINVRADTVAAYTALLDINIKEAGRVDKQSDEMATSSSMMILIATIIAIVAGLGIALYISKSITGPVAQVAENLNELKKGHLGARLNLTRKDEIGDMARTMDS